MIATYRAEQDSHPVLEEAFHSADDHDGPGEPPDGFEGEAMGDAVNALLHHQRPGGGREAFGKKGGETEREPLPVAEEIGQGGVPRFAHGFRVP